jgi:hypothetical protein
MSKVVAKESERLQKLITIIQKIAKEKKEKVIFHSSMGYSYMYLGTNKIH